jgi:hypothetical protein
MRRLENGEAGVQETKSNIDVLLKDFPLMLDEFNQFQMDFVYLSPLIIHDI